MGVVTRTVVASAAPGQIKSSCLRTARIGRREVSVRKASGISATEFLSNSTSAPNSTLSFGVPRSVSTGSSVASVASVASLGCDVSRSSEAEPRSLCDSQRSVASVASRLLVSRQRLFELRRRVSARFLGCLASSIWPPRLVSQTVNPAFQSRLCDPPRAVLRVAFQKLARTAGERVLRHLSLRCGNSDPHARQCFEFSSFRMSSHVGSGHRPRVSFSSRSTAGSRRLQ